MARITFEAALWRYQGAQAAWFFVTLPKAAGDELHFRGRRRKAAWGSIPVGVTVGATLWKTSVFPDRKTGSFLLPIKADVRRAESLIEGEAVSVELEFETEL